MSILDAGVQRPRDIHEAAQALEAVLLQTVLKSSGAFHGTEGVAGSDIRSDLFVGALADAVSKSGGMGLAAQLERSLGGGPAASSQHPTGTGVLAAPPPPPAERLLPTYRLPALDLPALGSRTPATAIPLAPAPDPADLPDAASGADAVWVRPVDGRVSSPFGLRTDPLNGRRAAHPGVDLAAPAGSPIAAAAGGVVVRAGARGGYGLAVEVEHDDETTTLYGHASRLLVNVGDRVDPGQPIALVGHTGRATGDHLHFELRRGGRPVDPSAALKVYRARAESSE
jgi:murein DD-endopeptidase MepM/ murein hydrolase activator NlpD